MAQSLEVSRQSKHELLPLSSAVTFRGRASRNCNEIGVRREVKALSEENICYPSETTVLILGEVREGRKVSPSTVGTLLPIERSTDLSAHFFHCFHDVSLYLYGHFNNISVLFFHCVEDVLL